MIAQKDLCNYLNQLLQPELYRDYCPNGLQIEGVANKQVEATIDSRQTDNRSATML